MINEPADDTDALQPLVQLKDHNIALLFSNYLLTLGIQAQLQGNEDGYLVLCPQDKVAQAKMEFDAFILQPHADKYQQAAWSRGETVTLNAGDYSLLNNFKENFLAHAGFVTLLTLYSLLDSFYW